MVSSLSYLYRAARWAASTLLSFGTGPSSTVGGRFWAQRQSDIRIKPGLQPHEFVIYGQGGPLLRQMNAGFQIDKPSLVVDGDDIGLTVPTR